MVNTVRSILLAAVPTLAALLGGLIWFHRKKKASHQLDYPKPPDKTPEIKAKEPETNQATEETSVEPVEVSPVKAEKQSHSTQPKEPIAESTSGGEQEQQLVVDGEESTEPVEEEVEETIVEAAMAQNTEAQPQAVGKPAVDSDTYSADSDPVDWSGQSTQTSHRSWGEEVENSVLLSADNLSENSTSACKVVLDSCEQDGDMTKSSESKTVDKCGSVVPESKDYCRMSEAAKLEVEVTEATSKGVRGIGCRSDRKDSASVESPQSVSSSGSHESASDAQSEMSSDSGKASSIVDCSHSPHTSTTPPTETQSSEPITPPHHNSAEPVTYEFDMPSDLCGMFIGRRGSSINLIKQKTGVEVAVKPKQFTEEYQLVCLRGTQHQVTRALDIIRHKFPKSRFPQLDLSPAKTEMPMLAPQIMQLCLPEGVSSEVVVSSVVSPNHVFVQQPTHPTFPSLERLNQCMLVCYTQELNMVPQLPRPIEVGVICAAPMYNSWYRAQVVQTYPETDGVDIKYVDYGGYCHTQGSTLRQIRSDFTSLPFQATECYLANVIPPADCEEFAAESSACLEELVQGRLLQAEVVCHEEDGVPYINLYLADNNRTWLLNRTLVDQGIARWVEQSA